MRNRFLILLSLISTAFASCIGNQEDEILEINGVKFNVTSTEMAIGDSLQLRATVLPYDKAFDKVQWDENIKGGKLLHLPQREDIPENIKEQLIVELYSKQ